MERLLPENQLVRLFLVAIIGGFLVTVLFGA